MKTRRTAFDRAIEEMAGQMAENGITADRELRMISWQRESVSFPPIPYCPKAQVKKAINNFIRKNKFFANVEHELQRNAKQPTLAPTNDTRT